MKIVALSIRRPVSVVVFFVALVIFGVISFRQLPVDLLPDLSFPTLTVRTEYIQYFLSNTGHDVHIGDNIRGVGQLDTNLSDI